jgi:hypothetical protein
MLKFGPSQLGYMLVYVIASYTTGYSVFDEQAKDLAKAVRNLAKPSPCLYDPYNNYSRIC